MPKTKIFKEILKNVKKTYLGKEVPLKYRNRYGKLYDEDEIESVAFAIAKSRGIKIDRRKK
jgi:hypothetical protein